MKIGVGEGAAIYHTAGALGNGERVWMLAKLPDDIQVAVGDISNKYLLLSNSHDGRSSVQIKFTPVRVVCNNTLVQALGSGETIRVSHTSDLRNRLDIARQNLRLINTRYTSIESTFRDMVRVKMDDTRLAAYLKLCRWEDFRLKWSPAISNGGRWGQMGGFSIKMVPGNQ